jgi:hypothetical protein
MRRPVFQTDTNGGIITKAPTDGEHARARALAKINPVSVADISHFAVDEVPPEHVVNPERDQRKTKHTPGVTHLRKPGSGSDLYQFSHRPLASSRAVVRPPIARPSDQLDHAQMHSAPRCHGALPAPARSPTSCAENYPPAGRRHHPIRMTPATNHARTSLNLTARRVPHTRFQRQGACLRPRDTRLRTATADACFRHGQPFRAGERLGDEAAARYSEWSAPGTCGAIVGVHRFQLARRGGHELAPADYRKRGIAIARRATALTTLPSPMRSFGSR